MFLAAKAGVKTGNLEVAVPNPNSGPLEVPVTTHGLPVVGFDFFGSDGVSVIEIALPREVAEEFQRLIADALGKGSKLETASHVPKGLDGAR